MRRDTASTQPVSVDDAEWVGEVESHSKWDGTTPPPEGMQRDPDKFYTRPGRGDLRAVVRIQQLSVPSWAVDLAHKFIDSKNNPITDHPQFMRHAYITAVMELAARDRAGVSGPWRGLAQMEWTDQLTAEMREKVPAIRARLEEALRERDLERFTEAVILSREVAQECREPWRSKIEEHVEWGEKVLADWDAACRMAASMLHAVS